MQILPQSLTYNAHTASTDILRLPETGGCSEWGILFNYTVTDSGVSAGENFNGAVDRLLIRDGDDGQAVFHAEADELDQLAIFTHAHAGKGHSSPTACITNWGTDSHEWFIDDLPTTAQAQYGYYKFAQNINFASLKNPVLELQFDASQEWAGASALSMACKFFYEPATVATTEYVGRIASPSETRSEIDLGSYPVVNVMLSTSGTVHTMTELKLQGADGDDDIAANETLEVFAYVSKAQEAGMSNSTDAPTTLMSGTILSEPHSNRKLIVVNSSAVVSTVHYISIARLIEHDESRATLGQAVRKGAAPVARVVKTKGRGRKMASLRKSRAKALGKAFRGKGFRGF